MAPRGTLASGAPQARRGLSAFPETAGQREIVETPVLRGHLAWPLGRGVPLDFLALLGSLESLVFPGSLARLGVRERREGQERGENGARRENAENRAEMAPPDLLVSPAPRVWTSQNLDYLKNKDPQGPRALRGSRAVMVNEAPKETGAGPASRETRASPERGVLTAARVCPESVGWRGLKGSRVCKVPGEALAPWVAMETLDRLAPRVSLAPRDPRDHLA